MAFIKVYIHFVWNTKKKLSFLAIKEIRKTVWNHIRENGHKKGIRIDFINGYLGVDVSYISNGPERDQIIKA